MKCFCRVLIALLAVGVVCQAIPVKKEYEDIERDKRQMKGSSSTSVAADQAELKFLGAPMLSPITAAAAGALQGIGANLQTGRQNGFVVQGPYGNMPGLGYGIPGGFGGPNGISAGLPGHFNTAGNIGATLSSYPSGVEMYPQALFGTGFYPNVGGPNVPGPFGPLDNAINSANMPGLGTQLISQPSQIQPQFSPFPLMAGYYPQMGYNQGYQNFQG